MEAKVRREPEGKSHQAPPQGQESLPGMGEEELPSLEDEVSCPETGQVEMGEGTGVQWRVWLCEWSGPVSTPRGAQ